MNEHLSRESIEAAEERNLARACIIAALLGLLFYGLFVASAFTLRAYATTDRGCVDAHAHPTGATAQSCRADGWVIRHRLVVNRHGVVRYSTLPSCLAEDGGIRRPCSWNINEGDGNGRGLSFWVDRAKHGHYVWRTDPTVNGWHWLDGRADCPVKGDQYKCANGQHGSLS